jgi:ADP-heptose:LPS heptosyltransferase
MNILIISISSLKNIVLSSPLIDAIKIKYPNAPIHLVTDSAHKEYVEKIPNISSLYFINGDAVPTIFELLKINFSFIIDLEETNSRFIIKNSMKNKYGSTAKVITYPKNVLAQYFFKKKAYSHKSLASQFIQVCKPLQLQMSKMCLTYFTNELDNLGKDDIPTSHKLGFVAINLDSLQLTDNNLIEICTSLNFPIALIGTKKEFQMAEQYKAIDPFKIYNACGKYAQAENYQILKHSKLLISSESLMIYQAAAAQKPIICVGKKQPNLMDITPYQGLGGNCFKHIIANLDCETIKVFIEK